MGNSHYPYFNLCLSSVYGGKGVFRFCEEDVMQSVESK